MKSSTSIKYTQIGVIHTPFKESKGTPGQPVAAPDSIATVELFPQYAEGLVDIEGFSHLILLFHMHKVKNAPLIITPFLDNKEHGVFATRSPARPNPIGLSVVKLEKVEHHILHISGVDILDGTPLLDIKPFIPAFDMRIANKTGWFDTIEHVEKKIIGFKDDGRFS
jgi:tRNA (adenine37-N6)-methyltransferase